MFQVESVFRQRKTQFLQLLWIKKKVDKTREREKEENTSAPGEKERVSGRTRTTKRGEKDDHAQT